MRLLLLAICLVGSALCAQGVTVRVKDVVSYRNTAPNTLVGEGLVFGLKGTGDDKDKKTQEMLRALSTQLNAARVPAASFASKNVARVQITVTVDAFRGIAGQGITCRVSIADRSKSLEHGTLFPTELRYALNARDDAIYGEARGALTLEYAAGRLANPGNGSVAGSILRDMPVSFFDTREDDYGHRVSVMTLMLKHPDSTTALEIARSINENALLAGAVAASDDAPPRFARAINDGAVQVTIPARWHDDEMTFKELVDTTSVNPDIVAQVTVQQKSGVVVFSGAVRLLPGSLSVQGIHVTIAAPEAGKPDTSLSQLLETFGALKLTAEERIAVIRALEQNAMLQAKVSWE